ncbi:hypothetical protein [Deinococcus frigens]|uniref:hypothetical protein n=1 Tax=Deinococcus frigens TaxID=249403 RepID=UPI000AA32F85|nr:hypothetical protein [Deinococcus frigens]
MPNTVEAGDIMAGGQNFDLRVRSDVIGGRDLEYRPGLPLPPPEVMNTALGPGTRASQSLYAPRVGPRRRPPGLIWKTGRPAQGPRGCRWEPFTG